MHNDDWHKPTRSQMRHDYAHCAYVYKTRNTLYRAMVACAAVFLVCAAFVGVMG